MIDRAHGRASSYVTSDIGAIESGRWHASHFSWKIGAMSLVKVGFGGGLSAAPARAGVNDPTAAAMARRPRGLHVLLISELLVPPARETSSRHKPYQEPASSLERYHVQAHPVQKDLPPSGWIRARLTVFRMSMPRATGMAAARRSGPLGYNQSVPRNAEVIRQWTILREIERARSTGVTVDDMAARCDVTTRTIRRDLQALEEAGFPLFDDRSRDDGKTRWCINGQAFKELGAGLTLSELSALYFCRTLVESLAGTPFREDVESAFEKLASALTPHMRQFLDQLPRVIAVKPDPTRRRPGDGARQQQIIARALEATLHQRQAILLYHSKSSERTKTYHVHPHRLAYAQGGLYLLAHVPEYGEVRTFAVERIRELSLLEERFAPIEGMPEEAFPDSLGVHSGPTEHVEIEFQQVSNTSVLRVNITQPYC